MGLRWFSHPLLIANLVNDRDTPAHNDEWKNLCKSTALQGKSYRRKDAFIIQYKQKMPSLHKSRQVVVPYLFLSISEIVQAKEKWELSRVPDG